ncbi:hypothetical protein DSO57_1006842 [Entomophthora muscae]|uniref:Uncharacterized protein n=1 Tax=Entomophthora muscae TaxID=34485 RepID=A0ACC2TVP1_9FUNG|nr:hypothetical protein DSO57_1006842 [Entomophthora muscae]
MPLILAASLGDQQLQQLLTPSPQSSTPNPLHPFCKGIPGAPLVGLNSFADPWVAFGSFTGQETSPAGV